MICYNLHKKVSDVPQFRNTVDDCGNIVSSKTYHLKGRPRKNHRVTKLELVDRTLNSVHIIILVNLVLNLIFPTYFIES